MGTAKPQITNLAEQAFWEGEYFGGVELPSRPDLTIAFERCLARGLSRHAAVDFGATVEGIEASAKGADLSRENLRLSRVEGVIHTADFFEFEPRPFDVVLSL